MAEISERRAKNAKKWFGVVAYFCPLTTKIMALGKALPSRILSVLLLGALLSAATKAADSAWRGDDSVKQNAWAIYQSEKKESRDVYKMERHRIWASYEAERERVWNTYDARRGQIRKVYDAERSQVWDSYRTNRTEQTYNAAVKSAQEAYSKATQLKQEAYAQAVAESQQAYRNATKQSQDAYACYVAKANRAHAVYLETIGKENRRYEMEAQVTAKCRVLPTLVQASCTAPAQTGLQVLDGNPTCEQKWGYHIAKVLVAKHFSEMSRLLDTREQGIIREDDICDNILSLSGAFLSIVPKQDEALRIIKSYFEIQKLLPVALGSEDNQIGTILADAVIETAKQGAIEELTGAVQPEVTIPVRVLKLINDSSTAWAVYNITKERYRLLVAQSYLVDYYKYGGNRSWVAEKYRLAKDASLDDIIGAIAKTLVAPSWISRKTWVPSDTARTAEHYEDLVRNMVAGCMEGQCGYMVPLKAKTKSPVACFFK